MNRRAIVYSILTSLVLMLLAIFFFDQPVAAFVQRVDGRSSTVLLKGTSFLEIVFGLQLAKYALTIALLAISALLFFWKQTRAAAWMLLFVGSAQFVTRFIVATLKPVFERLRPFQVIDAGNWDWKFFEGHGTSFPSGHGAFFWGLYFPLAYLFPRCRVPLLIIPLFVSVARVGVNDHWCSDVIGSIVVAGVVTLLFIWLFRMANREVEAPVNREP